MVAKEYRNRLNTNKKNKKMEKTFERHDIDDTPFSVITTVEDSECRITIANNIVSRKIFKTKEEAIKYVKKRPWELILNTTALFTEFAIKNQAKLDIKDLKK